MAGDEKKEYERVAQEAVLAEQPLSLVSRPTPQRGLENSAPPIKKIQGIGYFNSENKIRREKKRERGSGALAASLTLRLSDLRILTFLCFFL